MFCKDWLMRRLIFSANGFAVFFTISGEPTNA